MATYLFVHGSWHGGWCWHKTKRLHLENGDTVFTPTLTGMENKNKPAGKEIGLHTHINDIVTLIQKNNLSEIILVGHSYAGMVISGVASKVPEKIAKLIYLDAFLPNNGESLFDMSLPERVEAINSSLVNSDGKDKKNGASEVWLVPPHSPEIFGVFGDESIWLKERLVLTPVLTFKEKVIINHPLFERIPKFYIRCSNCPIPSFDRFVEKARNMDWKTYILDTGHDAMITKPEELFKILKEIERS